MPPLEFFMFYKTTFFPNSYKTKTDTILHLNIMLIPLIDFRQSIHYTPDF